MYCKYCKEVSRLSFRCRDVDGDVQRDVPCELGGREGHSGVPGRDVQRAAGVVHAFSDGFGAVSCVSHGFSRVSEAFDMDFYLPVALVQLPEVPPHVHARRTDVLLASHRALKDSGFLKDYQAFSMRNRRLDTKLR